MRIRKARATAGGYSLLELAGAMGVLLVIAFTACQIMTSSAAILGAMKQSSLFVREAGIVQTVFQRLVSTSDLFTIHSSLATAESATSAVQTGTFVHLYMRGGAEGAIGYDASGSLLFYYKAAGAGAWTAGTGIGGSTWTVGNNLTGVSFSGTGGVLRVTLTWAGGQSITVGAEGT